MKLNNENGRIWPFWLPYIVIYMYLCYTGTITRSDDLFSIGDALK